jgi:hypothetical protein
MKLDCPATSDTHRKPITSICDLFTDSLICANSTAPGASYRARTIKLKAKEKIQM